MRKLSAILLIGMGLSGCATNWYHPTASQSQFQSDNLACQDRANQAIPRSVVPIQQPTPVSNPSYSTTCTNLGTGTINCQTNSTAPAYNPQMAQANQAIAQGGSDFGRALGLSSYYESCMQSRGYSKTVPSASVVGGNLAPYAAFNQVLNGITVAINNQCMNPEYALYYKKTACTTDGFNPTFFADSSRASALEKKQILLVGEENRKHGLALVNAYKSLYPNKGKASSYVLLLESIDAMNAVSMKSLYQQKITWGEYNQKRNEIAQKLKSESLRIESQN